ncbi:hypothetical protein K402DRAFT_334395 [Aulographum hederae CBS 113979]|uniref:YDG domain-containing protein n=1 Tax=Aulographum hederae CBS 113979 TaxID=1176131 RepID=A0A6G1GWK6_9PEZI|nr:hypothetical protein K402DRAFT_334395 [Aulographum hederae CBS 113979]
MPTDGNQAYAGEVQPTGVPTKSSAPTDLPYLPPSSSRKSLKRKGTSLVKPSAKKRFTGRPSGHVLPSFDEVVQAIQDADPGLDVGLVHTAASLHVGNRDIVLSKDTSPEDDPRPEPIGHPAVWATSRCHLCSTLPYFQSYKSGIYSNGTAVYGFMFDGENMPRDYVGADALIFRAGGGWTEDENGVRTRNEDQTLNPGIIAVQLAVQEQTPIVIISGRLTSKMQSKMKYLYSVLGWFKPTHVFAEKANGKKVFRYRLERMFTEEQSWWAPTGRDPEPPLGSQPAPIEKTCAVCEKVSQQIYVQGWMCSNIDCTSAFDVPAGQNPDDLILDPRFLLQKTEWLHSTTPEPLVPNLPSAGSKSVAHITRNASRGVVCRGCGCCIPRKLWKGWECSHCGWEYSIPPQVIPLGDVQDDNQFHEDDGGYARSYSKCTDSVISREFSLQYNYRVATYHINGLSGCFVSHLIANRKVREEPNGPNDMFAQLQEQDIGLRRHTISDKKGEGESLPNHFSANFGMPYKYVIATKNEPFSDDYGIINQARSRLTWAAHQAVPKNEGFTEFNEILACGYFETQKMKYHSDGEDDLGPTVATLSLGAPATMKFRMKSNHFYGATKAAEKAVQSEPKPGCLNYEARKQAWDEIQHLSKKNQGEQMSSWTKTLGLGKSQAKSTAKRESHSAVLQLTLRHGDIVIMHGGAIQHYYEHEVVPDGFRFALTARTIDPKTINSGDLPVESVKPDHIKYDGSYLLAPPGGDIST